MTIVANEYPYYEGYLLRHGHAAPPDRAVFGLGFLKNCPGKLLRISHRSNVTVFAVVPKRKSVPKQGLETSNVITTNLQLR